MTETVTNVAESILAAASRGWEDLANLMMANSPNQGNAP
jgi:hypothetical protein